MSVIFLYSYLIHSIAPVVMGTALRGWAVFVFLVIPSMVVPYKIISFFMSDYVVWADKLLSEDKDRKIDELKAELSAFEHKKSLELAQKTAEIGRLRAEIGIIQDREQAALANMNIRYYLLSDLIKHKVSPNINDKEITEYKIRTEFRPNGDTILKSANNDNAIFVRTDLLKSHYIDDTPVFKFGLTEYYYLLEGSRFLMV